MTTTLTVDAARVELLLAELRLPTMKGIWPKLAAQADKEGWPAAKFLATLVEHELAERVTRRIERHRLESKLPPEKTLATFDFAAVPPVSIRAPPDENRWTVSVPANVPLCRAIMSSM